MRYVRGNVQHTRRVLRFGVWAAFPLRSGCVGNEPHRPMALKWSRPANQRQPPDLKWRHCTRTRAPAGAGAAVGHAAALFAWSSHTCRPCRSRSSRYRLEAARDTRAPLLAPRPRGTGDRQSAGRASERKRGGHDGPPRVAGKPARTAKQTQRGQHAGHTGTALGPAAAWHRQTRRRRWAAPASSGGSTPGHWLRGGRVRTAGPRPRAQEGPRRATGCAAGECERPGRASEPRRVHGGPLAARGGRAYANGMRTPGCAASECVQPRPGRSAF